jgi:hypothetical protein
LCRQPRATIDAAVAVTATAEQHSVLQDQTLVTGLHSARQAGRRTVRNTSGHRRVDLWAKGDRVGLFVLVKRCTWNCPAGQ